MPVTSYLVEFIYMKVGERTNNEHSEKGRAVGGRCSPWPTCTERPLVGEKEGSDVSNFDIYRGNIYFKKKIRWTRLRACVC